MKLDDQFPTTVTEDEDTLRLDQWLSRRYPDISRARWARLIAEQTFFTDGRLLGVANKLKAGQVIEFRAPEVTEAPDSLQAPESFVGVAPEVVFEDDILLVINKPVSMAVHPGSGVPLRETLVSWLLNTARVTVDPSNVLGAAPADEADEIPLDDSGDEILKWNDQELEEMRPGIVHRLDRGTSGLLVVAKNPAAHAKLAKQFSERSAGRRYQAVVAGTVMELGLKRPQRVDNLLQRDPATLALRIRDGKNFSFVSFLDRDPANRLRFRVSPEGQGRKAITHFTEVSKNSKFSLVELKLETGRTHQIRVHLSFLGFPILGDSLYNGMGFQRIMLHAKSLEFLHPNTGERVEFHCPWPVADREWLDAENLDVTVFRMDVP